jgi:hypothetical protein
MTAFSQPERRGLERMQTAAASHPDADLLAAFSEHSLTSREQEQVLAHLSVCQTCRDVVVLAGSQLVEPVSAPMRQRGLWEMPLFHWGAAAATAIVVVFAIAIGVRDYQPARKTAASATFDEVAPTPPAPAQQSADKVATEPAAKQAEGMVITNGPAVAAAKESATPTTTTTRAKHLQEQFRYERPAEADQATNGLPADKKERKDLGFAADAIRGQHTESLNVVGGAPGPAAPSSANESNAITNDAKTNNSRDAATAFTMKASPQETAKAAAVAPQNKPRSQTEVLDVTGAAPMIDTTTSPAQSQIAVNGAPTDMRTVQAEILAPRFQIAKHGQLQRASAQGWEDVLTSHKTLVYAVAGTRIFAGSTKGQLYASDDNGTTWKPISVHDGDTRVNGNITQLHFSDVQNGTLSTSAAETWTTSDGGQTWHKQ